MCFLFHAKILGDSPGVCWKEFFRCFYGNHSVILNSGVEIRMNCQGKKTGEEEINSLILLQMVKLKKIHGD